MSLENDSTSKDNQTGLNYNNSINTFHTSKIQNHNIRYLTLQRRNK